MRKKLIPLLLVVFILCFAGAAEAAQVVVDGKGLVFDASPVIQNGRVLVPLRGIFEALDAQVQWLGDIDTVVASKGTTYVELEVGGAAYKNGFEVDLEVPARIIKGRTMVPLRFVSEALGAQVDWDKESQRVIITSGKSWEGSAANIQAPEGLQTYVSDEAIHLSWFSNPEEEVAGYYVYEGKPGEGYRRVLFNDGHYLLNGTYAIFYGREKNQTYNYYVTAVTYEGLESAASEVVTANYYDAYEITYTWDFEGRTYSLGPIEVYQVVLDHYANKDHPPLTGPLKTLAIHTYSQDEDGEEVLNSVVEELEQMARGDGIKGDDVAEFVIAFVQSFPYVSDYVSTTYDDYTRYPLETLLEGEGDCEDTALLAAVLLKKLGFGSAVIIMPDHGHAAAGVLGDDTVTGAYYQVVNQKYFYLETTATDWPIGMLPEELEGASAFVVPL